VVLERVGMKRT